MGKWVAPYRLWRFSHKFEHPKSTPYYFSFPIILSVAHVIILYTHNPGTDLGTVARAQVHRPVTYFENCSLQTGHKEKYPEWYESRNCSLESERVFLFFLPQKNIAQSTTNSTQHQPAIDQILIIWGTDLVWIPTPGPAPRTWIVGVSWPFFAWYSPDIP